MSDLEAVRANYAAYEGCLRFCAFAKAGAAPMSGIPASRWLLDIVPVPKKSSATW